MRGVLKRSVPILAILTCGLTIPVAPAAADIRNDKGDFVFRGDHFTGEGKRTLPFNVAFRGGSPATAGKVAFHTAHGYVGWGKRGFLSSGVVACSKNTRYIRYISPNADPAKDVSRGQIMDGSDNPTCLDQRHARFFSDVGHSEQFGHQTAGNFMPTQVHAEKARLRHKVSETAPRSRYVFLKAMASGDGVDHYVQYHWILHPGAFGTANNKPHDRYIGRVSNAHR